jgi:hypothetical protein
MTDSTAALHARLQANLITAQVAVEAIANDRAAYGEATIAAVILTAENAGVSDFYLNMVR